jgi:hypothetical protein
MQSRLKHPAPVDLSGEIIITELKPRFNGAYSDVYIGQFRKKAVCLREAGKLDETRG